MEKYNYVKAMKQDIKEYIADNIDLSDFDSKENLQEHLYDALFVSDEVTGNASGSYFCNAYKAEKAICHNWDLLEEALNEFCERDYDIIEQGAEWADVTIRCYLLSQVLSDVLENVEIAV